jgi:hypothetical protein
MYLSIYLSIYLSTIYLLISTCNVERHIRGFVKKLDSTAHHHHSPLAWAAPNSTAEAAATQQETWFQNGWQGKNPPTPSEDSHVTEGTTGNGGFHNVGGNYLLSSVLDIEDIAHTHKKTLKEVVYFLIHHVEVNTDPESKCS